MPTDPAPLVAVVLPPREGFCPGHTGAVGHIARRLVTTPGFRHVVIGGKQPAPPFADVAFYRARPPAWWPGNINQRYAAGVARLVRDLRPALVEVHNRTEVALLLARRFPNTKVVLFLHNDPVAMRAARSPAQRKRLLGRLSGVVTVSDYLRRRLLDGIDDAPGGVQAVLPNCIDIDAAPSHGERDRTILFAGRVVPDKGPDAFVAACAIALPQLPGWRAAIIGADRFRANSPETDFTRRVATAAAKAGVTMLGYQDHPHVLDALAKTSIAVVPSRWQEPFGLAALEAMASGAAVICSPRGGLPEVGGDAVLYANPDRPQEIADAILTLARDPADRVALAEAGRARAAGFSVAAATARLAGLRRQILGCAGG